MRISPVLGHGASSNLSRQQQQRYRPVKPRVPANPVVKNVCVNHAAYASHPKAGSRDQYGHERRFTHCGHLPLGHRKPVQPVRCACHTLRLGWKYRQVWYPAGENENGQQLFSEWEAGAFTIFRILFIGSLTWPLSDGHDGRAALGGVHGVSSFPVSDVVASSLATVTTPFAVIEVAVVDQFEVVQVKGQHPGGAEVLPQAQVPDVLVPVEKPGHAVVGWTHISARFSSGRTVG